MWCFIGYFLVAKVPGAEAPGVVLFDLGVNVLKRARQLALYADHSMGL
jgi:hypothetical protein